MLHDATRNELRCHLLLKHCQVKGWFHVWVVPCLLIAVADAVAVAVAAAAAVTGC